MTAACVKPERVLHTCSSRQRLAAGCEATYTGILHQLQGQGGCA